MTDIARKTERYETVVIGGGQAGLSVGYHLSRRGRPFVILEGRDRVGDAWRDRWDSLRLFTPAGFSGLDGMPFPAHRHSFPPKDAMADYLESYVSRFRLPVRTGTRVDGLTRENGAFVVSAGGQRIEADHVVVAMANYQEPRTPSFSSELDPSIVQVHSARYRNPSELRAGPVLIVGAGNSGAEIARELAPRHETWVSGRDVGQIPFRISGFLGRWILVRLTLKGIFMRVLSVKTPMGRKARPQLTRKGGPLIRVKRGDLERAGVRFVPKVAGVKAGKPVLEDGRVLDVANVVWCTGYHPGFDWIRLPVFDDDGEPAHHSGIVDSAPGLYFVGLHFLHSLSSAMIHGVGRDADRIAEAIAGRAGAGDRVAGHIRAAAAVV